jgi:hypothetical protein
MLPPRLGVSWRVSSPRFLPLLAIRAMSLWSCAPGAGQNYVHEAIGMTGRIKRLRRSCGMYNFAASYKIARGIPWRNFHSVGLFSR